MCGGSSRYVDIELTRYYLHRYLGQLLGHCQNVLIISDTGEAEERGEWVQGERVIQVWIVSTVSISTFYILHLALHPSSTHTSHIFQISGGMSTHRRLVHALPA